MNTLSLSPAPPVAGRPVAVACRSAEAGQHLIFTLGGEPYAIGILNIREIIEYGDLTEVPMMPAVVRGMINLRGAVVPVIDLAARFGRGRTPIRRRSCVVIVDMPAQAGSQVIGLLVDGVNEVQDIAADQIEPPPTFGARLRTDFIAGMCRLGNRFVIMLDVRHLLAIEDPQVPDAAAGEIPQVASAA